MSNKFRARCTDVETKGLPQNAFTVLSRVATPAPVLSLHSTGPLQQSKPNHDKSTTGNFEPQDKGGFCRRVPVVQNVVCDESNGDDEDQPNRGDEWTNHCHGDEERGGVDGTQRRVQQHLVRNTAPAADVSPSKAEKRE